MFPSTIRIAFVAIVFPIIMSAQNIAESLLSSEQLAEISPIILPELNIEQLKKEDQNQAFDVRFAAPTPCQISLKKNGEWSENDKNERVWTCKIKAQNGEGLSFLYKNFYLPKGARLYVFSADKKQILGPFTDANNNAAQTFMTTVILGDEVILQYFEPNSISEKGSFEIFSAYQVYKKYHLQLPHNQEYTRKNNEESTISSFGFNSSLACHVNINCPDVDTSVRQIQKGVVRIVMVLKEGMGYCTGTLMNNTAQDGKPYILTAFHCQDGYTPLYNFWAFDFYYEHNACSNSTTEPKPKTLVGCDKRSGWVSTDFLLLELTSPIPNSFNTYYNGWNRQAAAPQGKVMCMHHPSGDVKKYLENNGTQSTFIYPSLIKWNNSVTTPAQFHFKTVPTKGIIEIGSSGCGLFNSKKQLVGNFNGGDFNNCSVLEMFFGRLSKSWDGNGTPATRLKDWLDPIQSDSISIDGTVLDNRIVSGKIDDPLLKGTAFKMAFVAYNGSTILRNDTVNVTKTFAQLIPPNTTDFLIQPIKQQSAVSNVSTSDLVMMNKHILGTQLMTDDWRITAADVNNNDTVSTADMVEIKKVILGLKTDFDKLPSWIFKITDKNITNMTVTPTAGAKLFKPFQSNNTINFQGIKIGDPNGSSY
jgi:lysyl endopeptidase